jgi:hypothetical protein
MRVDFWWACGATLGLVGVAGGRVIVRGVVDSDGASGGIRGYTPRAFRNPAAKISKRNEARKQVWMEKIEGGKEGED